MNTFFKHSSCKHSILIIIVGIIWISCAPKDSDEESPILELFTLNGSEFQPGDAIEINVAASDNENVGQIRVRIRDAFSKTFTAWEVLQINDFAETFVQRNYFFAIPDSALAGYYALSVQAADLDGNASKDSTRYISILQPGDMPELIGFTVQPPIIEETLILNSSDSLIFTGTAFDDIRLKIVTVDLQTKNNFSISRFTKNLTDTVTVFDFALLADTLRPDFDDRIPARLLVKIIDSDGNLLRKSIPVDYTP